MYETEMKALLLNYLLDKDFIQVGDTVLNEFTFSATSRRVDLAVVKDDLFLGVEIKSQFDSLERLSGQLAEYSKYFDKVLVFTTEKHESQSLKLLKGNEELLILSNNGKVKRKKRGKIVKISDKSSYIKMMRARELAKACSHFNLSAANKNRAGLEKTVRSLATKNLRQTCFQSLKSRYSEKSKLFWSSINSEVQAKDVNLLSKNEAFFLTNSGDGKSIASLLKEGKL